MRADTREMIRHGGRAHATDALTERRTVTAGLKKSNVAEARRVGISVTEISAANDLVKACAGGIRLVSACAAQLAKRIDPVARAAFSGGRRECR